MFVTHVVFGRYVEQCVQIMPTLGWVLKCWMPQSVLSLTLVLQSFQITTMEGIYHMYILLK